MKLAFVKKLAAVAISTIFVTGFFFTCTAIGNSDLPELKVGMECAYAPFNWTQTDNSNDAVPIAGGGYAAGYDVEIAKKIADGLVM